MKHLKKFNQYLVQESLSEFDGEDTSKWIPVYEYFYDSQIAEPKEKTKKVTKYTREDGTTLSLQSNGKWKSSKSGNEYSQAAVDNLVNNHEINVVTWEPAYEKNKVNEFFTSDYVSWDDAFTKATKHAEDKYGSIEDASDSYSYIECIKEYLSQNYSLKKIK